MRGLKRLLFGALAAIAVAGCGGVQTTGSGAAPPLIATRRAALDRLPSYMAPDAKKKSRLMYVGDWATNDVFVYEYPSGDSVGTLRGFDGPYGMCVNKKGDVYIANFYSGNVVEYAHGGTSPLKTYTSVGEPIGCSVRQKRRSCRYELQSRRGGRLCRRRSVARHNVQRTLRVPLDDGI